MAGQGMVHVGAQEEHRSVAGEGEADVSVAGLHGRKSLQMKRRMEERGDIWVASDMPEIAYERTCNALE